jgi:hypothetical protein
MTNVSLPHTITKTVLPHKSTSHSPALTATNIRHDTTSSLDLLLLRHDIY